MNHWFSPIFIGLGQTIAILLFLLYDDRGALLRRPARLGLAAVFTVIHTIAQAHLREYLEMQGWGSLPAVQFLAASWASYAFFLWLWYCPLQIQPPRNGLLQYDSAASDALSWPVCCFLALVFLLVDNSVWPLVSSTSRLLCGVNHLYDGSIASRLPWLSLFVILESALLLGTRQLLPKPEKILLDWFNITLTLMSVIPFLCIRLFLAQLENQNNKLIQIIMTVCCLVATLTLTSGVGHASEQYEKIQEDRMQYVLQMQQKLFEQKLNDIDRVNRKYHDMKNILLYLQAGCDSSETGQEVERLLSSIRPFESRIRTGHEVIDIILSEKLSLCQEREITCVPYLDGSLLSGIKPLDLCTIFGNAMDNAIESCSQLSDAEKRQISIHNFLQGGYVVLTFRNTFAQAPVLRGGLPVTTKAAASEHGYGLKNILYLVEKYSGTMNCSVEGDEFVLTLLLPEDRNA